MNIVYLIGNKKAGLYKIGVSKSPNKRLKSNQTSCPFELEIINTFPSKYAYQIEKRLQKDFSYLKKDENENTIKGEWFCLAQKQIDEFLKRCTDLENNFDILINADNYHFNKFLKK